MKKKINSIIKLLDIIFTLLISLIVYPFIIATFFGLFIFALILRRGMSSRSKRNYRNLLRLVPAQIADILKKDVIWMLYDSDENGYFNHVYTIHYPAQKSCRILLNEKHTIIEIGRILVFLKDYGFYFLYLFLNGIYFLVKITSMQAFVLRNIDIIRGHEPDHMGLAALILHILTGIPFCVSVHADHDKRYEITGGRSIYLLFDSKLFTDAIRKIVLSHSPMVMIIRESLRGYVVKKGAKPDSIYLIPHGIHLDWFNKVADLQFQRFWKNNGRKLVVFCGRLSPENYIEDVINIAGQVKAEIPSVLFLIIGDGIERKNAELLVKEKGLIHNVLFLGYQPLEKVIQFRKIADVNLCLMAGFSLIEAAAAGRPIVSYDIEWHYELVRDQETGYLIKEHNIRDASKAIIKIINNPELVKRLGDAARRLAIKNYSIEMASARRIHCYDILVKSRQ
jgi:glycosyltransferase involved in cell wall biosynthesis